MNLPIYRCGDCQDAELFAWWDSMTEAVIRSHRIGLAKGFLAGALLAVPATAELVWRYLG